MFAWSEPRLLFVNIQYAVLRVIYGVLELVNFCPGSSFFHHPISRAFSGNPLFPLATERSSAYLTGSRDSFTG